MNKLYLLLSLIVSTAVFALPFNHSNYDFYTPKVNHGVLLEQDINKIENKLGLGMSEIVATPDQRQFKITHEWASNYDGLSDLKIKKFFEQKIEGIEDKVYRVTYIPMYGNSEEEFSYQKIYIKRKNDSKAQLCFEGFLTYREYGWQSDIPEVFGGTMLIARNGNIDGVFAYNIRYKTQHKGIDDPFGEEQNTQHAYVYFFREDKQQYNAYIEEADIEMTASWSLIEGNTDIFKYTIQNAFDQNPATSYIEDTDDDLIEITSYFSDNYFNILKSNNYIFNNRRIINGYAKNDKLYENNNRIKMLYKTALSDNQLEYQYIPYSNPKLPVGIGIIIKDIYKGNLYNDTCLAEFDWQFINDSWLFGGIDE